MGRRRQEIDPFADELNELAKQAEDEEAAYYARRIKFNFTIPRRLFHAVEGRSLNCPLEITFEHAFKIWLDHFPVWHPLSIGTVPGPSRAEQRVKISREDEIRAPNRSVTTRLPRSLVKSIKVWSIDAGRPQSFLAFAALRHYMIRDYQPLPRGKFVRDKWGNTNLPAPNIMEFGDERGRLSASPRVRRDR